MLIAIERRLLHILMFILRCTYVIQRRSHPWKIQRKAKIQQRKKKWKQPTLRFVPLSFQRWREKEWWTYGVYYNRNRVMAWRAMVNKEIKIFLMSFRCYHFHSVLYLKTFMAFVLDQLLILWLCGKCANRNLSLLDWWMGILNDLFGRWHSI